MGRPLIAYCQSPLRRIGCIAALCLLAAAAHANNCQTTPSPTPYPTATPYPNSAGIEKPSPRVRPLTVESQVQRDVKDAILARRIFTQPELAALDLNHDGALDIADYHQAWATENPGNLSDFTRPGETVTEGFNLLFVPVQFAFPFTGTLTYSVSGSATPGIDYQTLSGQQGVDGRRSDEILIVLLDDDQFEDPDTIIITLISSDGYTSGIVDTYTVTIGDNDTRFAATADSGLSRSDLEIQIKQVDGVLTGALAGSEKSLIPAGLWPLDLQIDNNGDLVATSGLFPVPAAASPFAGVAYQRSLTFSIKGFDPIGARGTNVGTYQEQFQPTGQGSAFAFGKQGTIALARIPGLTIPAEPTLVDAP